MNPTRTVRPSLDRWPAKDEPLDEVPWRRLFLVRHGESTCNEVNRFAGHADVPAGPTRGDGKQAEASAHVARKGHRDVGARGVAPSMSMIFSIVPTRLEVATTSSRSSASIVKP